MGQCKKYTHPLNATCAVTMKWQLHAHYPGLVKTKKKGFTLNYENIGQ